jgi:ATP-binding cassette subfamily F protein 2
VLGIHPLARDIKIDNFSVTFYGAELLQDTKLELSVGNRCVPGWTAVRMRG